MTQIGSMESKILKINRSIQKLIDTNNDIINIVTVAEKQLSPQFIIKRKNDDDIVIKGYDDMEKFIKKMEL